MGDGVRVATPVALQPQPTPGLKVLGAEHDGTRYQVTDGADPPNVVGPFRPAEYFEAFFDNFAASGGLRRDGPTERLRAGSHLAAQARFAGSGGRAVVRVVRWGNRTTSLAVMTTGSIEEGNPAVGGFLNALEIKGPAR